MILIKRSITAIFFCIFELFLKYSESVISFDGISGRDNILVEVDEIAHNNDEAIAKCALHDAILIPFYEEIYKNKLLKEFSDQKGKHKKGAFCCKKLIFL